MSLGDHLRADKDINIEPVKCMKDAAVIPPSGGGIAVHACHPGLGKHTFYGFLQSFGADAIAVNTAALTGGTMKGDRNSPVTVMTLQNPFTGVVRQGYGTVQAAKDMTAMKAGQERVETPAI